jgi:hypothetical protein
MYIHMHVHVQEVELYNLYKNENGKEKKKCDIYTNPKMEKKCDKNLYQCWKKISRWKLTTTFYFKRP